VETFPVDPGRIERRAQFYLEIGRAHGSTPLLRSAGVHFDEALALTLSEAYFLLSESYKTYRNHPGHLTAKPKIAAMHCAAVCAVNPFRPNDPSATPLQNYEVVEIRYANPMYAMRCACTPIEHPYHMRAFDERRRIYDELTITAFPCLDPFLADTRADRKKPLIQYNTRADEKFSVGISLQEITKIESFVSRFEVYQQQKIYAAVNNLRSRVIGP
jgi:hypothetical protein